MEFLNSRAARLFGCEQGYLTFSTVVHSLPKEFCYAILVLHTVFTMHVTRVAFHVNYNYYEVKSS